MKLIAVTDIFGKTNDFKIMIDQLSPKYHEVEIIDPYVGIDNSFQNEEEAYNCFQQTMGLKKYSEILLQTLKGEKSQQTTVLGFSVGASAIWAISDQLKTPTIKAVGFYSSQIRDYLKINPQIKIELFFSKNEPCYHVETIIKDLSIKAHVKCHKTPYLHGFMNKQSKNYNQSGYNRYLEIINKIA